MIYTEEQISENPLFSDLMQEINALHEEHGCPAVPDSGPTTDFAGYESSYGAAFTTDSVGDWDGQEEAVVENALSQLEVVMDGLNHGPHPFYYDGDEAWDEFKRRAMQEVNWDLGGGHAYDRMCNDPDLVSWEGE